MQKFKKHEDEVCGQHGTPWNDNHMYTCIFMPTDKTPLPHTLPPTSLTQLTINSFFAHHFYFQMNCHLVSNHSTLKILSFNYFPWKLWFLFEFKRTTSLQGTLIHLKSMLPEIVPSISMLLKWALWMGDVLTTPLSAQTPHHLAAHPEISFFKYCKTVRVSHLHFWLYIFSL